MERYVVKINFGVTSDFAGESPNSAMEKFKEMNLHKCRKPLEQIAKEIKPLLRGIINYYHHFRKDDLFMLWFQLNARLQKWI